MADTIATVRTKKDGVLYEVGDTIPDMGSLVCVSNENGIKQFEGFSEDAEKLPVTNLKTGSQALFYDTGIVKKFEEKSGSWTVLGGE